MLLLRKPEWGWAFVMGLPPNFSKEKKMVELEAFWLSDWKWHMWQDKHIGQICCRLKSDIRASCGTAKHDKP
jgi:hypothetical protein